MKESQSNQVQELGVTEESTPDLERVRFIDLVPAFEFVCWTIVVFAVLLRWVNGPAVTNDQWRIQVVVFASALVSGILLRITR